MSNEPKRLVEIDQKIGALSRTLDQIIISMRSALQREWEMEQLAEEYYTLLKVVSEEHWTGAMTPFWNKQRQKIQKQAEAMGISHERKGET